MRGRCLCKTFSTRCRSPSWACQSDLRNPCHGSPAICCWLLGCACLRPSAFHSLGTSARPSAVALLPALGLVAQLRERLWPHAQERHRFWAGRRGPACGPPLCAPASRAERTGRGGAGRAGAGHGSDAGGGCGSPLSPGCAQAPAAEGPAQAQGGAVVPRTSRSPASEAAGPGAGAAAAESGERGEEGAGRGRGRRPLCAAPLRASGAPAGRRGGHGDPERAPHPPRLLRPPLRPAPPLMARTSAGRRLPSSRARRPRGPLARCRRALASPAARSTQHAARTRSRRNRRNRRGRRRAANNDRGWRAAAGVDGPGRGGNLCESLRPRPRVRAELAAGSAGTVPPVAGGRRALQQ